MNRATLPPPSSPTESANLVKEGERTFDRGDVEDMSIESSGREIKIREVTGDIFQAPENAVLVHATNCLGEWGSGIAAQFRRQFPAAYAVYRDVCQGKTSGRKDGERLPLGECLLIEPQVDDYGDDAKGKKYWIACLFTSMGYGGRITNENPGRSSEENILRHTRTSLRHFVTLLIDQLGQNISSTNSPPNEIWMCQFNSGNFRVPWEKSLKVVKGVFADWKYQDKIPIVVVTAPSMVSKNGRQTLRGRTRDTDGNKKDRSSHRHEKLGPEDG